jgi:hypothetical protein
MNSYPLEPAAFAAFVSMFLGWILAMGFMQFIGAPYSLWNRSITFAFGAFTAGTTFLLLR